jgi:hypothetical protein
MVTKSTTDIKAVLHDVKESQGVILHGFRSRNELRDTMQQAINTGKKCAFVPSLKTLRKFLNTQGFIAVMMEVSAELYSHNVIIEPGVYNSMHVFVVGPNSPL